MIVDGENITFAGMLDHLAERCAGRLAFVVSDHSRDAHAPLRCTYDALARDVRALQAALAERGIEPGDRVAVMLSSVPEWILYLFAVTRLGAVFLPVNPRFGSHELDYVLRHSGACAVVSMGHYLGRDYAEMLAEVTGPWSPGPGSPGEATSRLPSLRHLIGVRNLPHPMAIDTEALLERGRQIVTESGVPDTANDPGAPAILFYTSGTTAFPKGVPLSHANLLPHTVRCGALLDLAPDDRILSLYPFFGVSGGANKVLSTFAAGACLVFQDAFRAQEALALLHAEDCGVVHAVDVQIRELVRLAEAAPAKPRERRGTIAFMAGLDEALARRMGDVLGLKRFVHPYGMTETNPMILRNHMDDPFEVRLRPGGRVAPQVELRVIDPETGADQKEGVPGEIVVRGPTVMRGYFRDPQATEQAFRGGWFHTGDLGVGTPDGFIFYTGRMKDMLKVGGFNVAPQEVEEYLRKHAAIEDVAATGAPDERLGEVVVAFVKPRPDAQVDEAELRTFCAGHLANFKTPRRIYLVDKLPYHTAANGSKLQRHVLREWARERAEAQPG